MVMKLEGSIVALITPMSEDGAVDYAALTRLVDFHVDNGTKGIVSVGTTGESATLTIDEHMTVVEHTIKAADRRISVVAGTGANSTQEAIEWTTQAEKLGADAALLVVPYYNKPTQEGLYQHYKMIADKVPIEQILYNVPGRTSLKMDNDTVLRLAEIENIIGIKDATGDVAAGADLIQRCGESLVVISGDDVTALQLMKAGGKGDISVTANVAPEKMSQMCEAALVGDFATAETLNKQLMGLHTQLFLQSNPIPVKYAMAKLGYTSNTLRLPLTALSEQFEQPVNDAMAKAEISL